MFYSPVLGVWEMIRNKLPLKPVGSASASSPSAKLNEKNLPNETSPNKERVKARVMARDNVLLIN